MICTVLPTLRKARFIPVNLAKEAAKRQRGKEEKGGGGGRKNPYVSVTEQNRLLEEVKSRYGADVTFGGYLEDRSALWQGFEPLSATMRHLGVDINNLLPGTPVAAPRDCVVVHTYKDESKHNGWGGRLILRISTAYLDCDYLLIGHLDCATLPIVGTAFKKGEIVGHIATPDGNGNWFPHGHFQLVKQAMMDRFKADLNAIDGYMLDGDYKDASTDEWSADPTFLLFQLAAASVEENRVTNTTFWSARPVNDDCSELRRLERLLALCLTDGLALELFTLLRCDIFTQLSDVYSDADYRQYCRLFLPPLLYRLSQDGNEILSVMSYKGQPEREGETDNACALFINLYGEHNAEFALMEETEAKYDNHRLTVLCKTHGIQFALRSRTFSHFELVGEKDFCEIRCSIPAFKSVKKDHTVRFECSAGKPLAAVVVWQKDCQ